MWLMPVLVLAFVLFVGLALLDLIAVAIPGFIGCLLVVIVIGLVVALASGG